MKNIILALVAVLLLVGCNKPSNKLAIVFSKTNPADSVLTSIRFLQLKNDDSIVYKASPLLRMSSGDTLRIDSLHSGNYTLEFNNLLGDRILKRFSLDNEESKAIKIMYDSISLKEFYPKIPFSQLKEGELYKIEGKGGCVATLYRYYQILKKKNNYYSVSADFSKVILNDEQINAIRRFEAELLAIEGKGGGGGTGRMTYKIIKEGKEKIIVDNTDNWNGWENMSSTFNKDQ